MERINTRKGPQITVQCSKCYDNFNFLSKGHRSIATDFYFLPYREKAHGNNKFCHENQRSWHESQITTC